MNVNSTHCKGKKVESGKPVIKFWDAKKLIEREKEEMELGGFGKLEIVGKEEKNKLKLKFTKKTARRQMEGTTNDDAKGTKKNLLLKYY